VTSDTEARTDDSADLVDDSATDPAADTSKSCWISARYFGTAVGFLGLGLLLLLLLAVKRVFPDFLSGIEFLSYGRLVPAATSLLLNGWLTIGLLGALLFIVPRTARVDIEDPSIVRAALGLLVVAYLGGALAALGGYTEGRRYLEPLLIFDALALVGLIAVARSITRVARRSHESNPVVWYSAAAVLWLLLTHVVGNLPGLGGYVSQLQASFYRSSLTGLWLASAAVAIVYYVVPRLAGRPPLQGTKLSVLGIWSLGFVWAMTGPAELTFGAAGDWLETIGVIFSIVLFLPILVIATDLIHAMRGAWENVRDRVALRLVTAGVAMFGVYALFNLLQALRASSAVVGFTDWVAAVEILLLLGPFSFILFGLLRLAAPELFGTVPSYGMVGYRTLLSGLLVTVGAMAVAGVQTGFTWIGAANTANFLNSGAGWVSTSGPLAGSYVVQLVGLMITVIGVVLTVYSATAFRAVDTDADPLAAEPAAATDPEPDLYLDSPPSVAKVRRYAYGFFALAALMVFVLPSLEGAEATLLADTGRTYEPGSLIATGRSVYVQEGCVYCHTQQVRPIVTDVGIGPVSVQGDYANETPVLIGVQRYGPDLMHLGLRSTAESVQAHLQSPRAERSWSIMPTYDYLTIDEQSALAAYLVGEE